MANITTQTIRVDLSTDKTIPTAYTHQNDTARTLVFDMYSGGMPYTMTGNTVKFAYKSPIVNGQHSVIAGASMASGTVSGNKVSVTLPVAYTRISGVGMLTMIITPTSGTVRPVNIRLVVQKSADGANEIAGASDFPTTLQQIADEWYDENIADWLNENIESVYDAEAFGTAIDTWLDDHPEATTTVQDGAITEPKLYPEVKEKLNKKNIYANVVWLYEDLDRCQDPSQGFGACCVLWNSDTCIVNDFGYSVDGNTLPNFLNDNGIEKVDAVIVSHYHDDHINSTSLNALINSGVDLSNCTFYLPHYGIDRTQAINSTLQSSMEQTIKGILTNNNIPYVEPNTEGYEVEIGGFTVNFYNVTAELYADYYNYKWYSKGSYETDATRYNNFSMCANVNIGGSNVFLSGDIEYPAQENMASNVARADVYMVSHHGRNLRESQSFINNMSCKVGVIPTYCDINGGSTEGILCPTAGRCRDLGTLISTHNRNASLVIDGGRVYSDSSNDIQNGACLGQILLQGTDFDDLGFGDYYCSGSADVATFVNAPPFPNDLARTFTVHVEPLNANTVGNNRIVQIVTVRSTESDSGMIYKRNKIDTWSNWVPLTLALTTEDVSSRYFSLMLGMVNPKSIRGYLPAGEVTDFNEAYVSGVYITGLSASNIPTGFSSAGYLLVLSFKNSSNVHRCIQFWSPFDSDSIKYRRCVGSPTSSSNWTAWKSLSIVS